MLTLQHTNLEMFCTFFKNDLQSDDRDKYPLVKAFIEIREKLHILKYLPKIIEFHRRLVKGVPKFITKIVEISTWKFRSCDRK